MDVISLAAELVQIPSINPAGQEITTGNFGEAAIAGRIKTLLRGMGAAEVETTYPLPGRPNVIAFFDFGAADTVLFEAHIDTVPVEGMTVAPFGGEIRDDKILGRGACDVKGPMAAMLCAIEQAKARGLARYNVLFAAVCDEESGFSGVRHMLKNLRPEWKGTLRFAVVAEPTDLQPVIAHKGVVRWNVTARGISAHSSTPEVGQNAIYAMARAITCMQEYGEELRKRAGHEKLGAASLSVGTISGGTAVNVVPEFCTAHVDRRLIPGERTEAALEELRQLLRAIEHVEVSAPTVAAPAFEVPEDNVAVQACLAAARAAGCGSAPQYANYCTDASFYAEHGIGAVVFGPGSIAQAHTADEWISVRALQQGVKAYLNILS
jgi:acetylornithine deacetylase/succinyl-diaminopimelate desuccinylase family protein